ncbi:MAG: hypothetical protein ACRD6X_13000 [Pyrinomonadaceae bacterium]
MKVLNSTFAAYRKYRKFTKTNKKYKAINYTLAGILAVYGLILIFPQILFAHQASYKNFNVYSRQPLNENLARVLDTAEERLLKSPIYNQDLKENVFLADSFGLYKFFTLSSYSLGSTIPVIGHSRINVSDIDKDLVFRNTEPPNSRLLSGVIAHETMHNQLREKFGFIKYMQIPKWKDEGYCEYVAGETTLLFDEGLRLWRENPNDSSKYDYFKYYQMVKYLLDEEKISVDEFFKIDFDEKELKAKVFEKINQN